METPVPQTDAVALDPRRILIRGVNWLGDAVMTTPALRRLRERFPHAHLTLLTPEKLSDLWQGHPDLDAVLAFRAGASPLAVAMQLRGPMVRAGFREATRALRDTWEGQPTDAGANRESAARVRRSAFDLAVVLPNSPRSALEVWLARIAQRLGYARPWRNWFLTLAVPPRPGRVEMRKRRPREIRALLGETASAAAPPRSVAAAPGPDAHQIHDYLHLVAAVGAEPTPTPPLLHVTTDEVAATARRFGLAAGPGTQPLVGLNAGAEYGPAKRWPVEHFVAAVHEVERTRPCHWLILGGPGDAALAHEVAARLQHPASGIRHPGSPVLTSVAGQTSLRELMALLRLCRVVLTNDTGPMHLAAALGTPVVVPFGSTSPELTGPGLPGDPRHQLLRSDAACAPCFLRECPVDFRCLTGIPPAAAARAVLAAVRD